MKPKIYLFIPVLIILGIMFSSYSGENGDYPGGAPAGYTGSPGDGQDCHNCHGGSTAPVTGWITSDIPPQGYTPGTTYAITVTVTGTGKKGFEVSPQNVSGTQLGTLIAGTGNHLVGGSKYVTQNSSNNSGTATWTFNWTAPAAGTGPVTFYGAFCVGKSNTKTSTLNANEFIPFTVSASASPSQICNGGSSSLQALAAGGSGTYTFSWTSNPPGFVSNQQNPTVSPTLTTQYIVSVNDGTQTTSDTTQVDVTDPPAVFAGNDTTVTGQTLQIPLNGTATNYSSVLWSTSGDGTFGNANALSTSYTLGQGDKTSGGVSLTLTASPNSPCSQASSTRNISIIVGISDPPVNRNTMMILPNPSTGVFKIRVPSEISRNARIMMYDVSGMMVYYGTSGIDASGLTGQIDLSGLSKGIYSIRLNTGGTSHFAKLVLQ